MGKVNLRKTVPDKSHYYLQTSKGTSVLVAVWGPSTSVLSSRVTSKSSFGKDTKSSSSQPILGYPNPNKVTSTYKKLP